MTAALLRIAARRPHVLVVAVPGAVPVRLALEAALAQRGWPAAAAPADADVLAVAGVPGPRLAAVAERIWSQVPAPRARIGITGPADVGAALDAAAPRLRDVGRQRTAQAERPDDPADPPMADLGEDRDGLTLDRLHVPLGPVLPEWPAGLVVRATLQGDVVQEAEAEVLDPGPPFAWPNAVARELDALARFLGVAGWPAPAARARALRDRALVVSASAEVDALVRRVRRSRTLWWSVRGLPTGPTDVAALLQERLGALERGEGTSTGRAVEELPDLLVGAELAAARLIIAAADPDTERVAVPGPADG
ncbi:hypothetical protein CFP66_01820 [Pseudonocardia sp. MH-G8]|nr:hypothetical protein CFP66_01820 [Pseudonocardia sp. MH-G8]